MKNKAQSILEYAIILAIVGLALGAMQLYYRRSIQAVVKLAADDVGEQRKGALEYDYKYEWKWKGESDITTSIDSSKTTSESEGGVVSYSKDATTKKTGILSWGGWVEKE